MSILGSVLFLTSHREELLLARQQQSPADARGKQEVRGVVGTRGDLGSRSNKRWVPLTGDTLKINVDDAFCADQELLVLEW